MPEPLKSIRPTEAVRSRMDWLSLAERLVGGAVRNMSPDGSHVLMPGEPSRHGVASDGMEGFSRTLLLHAFRIAGDPATAAVRHTDRYLEGLTNGLREGRYGHTWLPIEPKGHAIPEAASIALALSVAPAQLWAPLDAGAQSRIAQWLRAAVSAAPYDNNWRLFGPVAGAFLTSIGEEAPGLEAARSLALDSLSEWETPDGWVSDGSPSSYDYYSSFALNYYPLMLAAIHRDQDFAARREPARRFVATLPALIASNGAPVYFGRSLTYRFGVMAAVSAAALADALPWEPAKARELTSDVVEYFVRGGAIEDDDTVLPGWFGAGSAPVQSYSGPAASYWLSKTFANLLLPAEHSYWAAPGGRPEAPDTAVLARGLLAVARPSREVVRLVNHGSISRSQVQVGDEPEEPEYSRLEYSSASAPSLGGEGRSGGIVIERAGGLAAPGPLTNTGQGEGWAASRASLRMAMSFAKRGAQAERVGKRSVHLVGYDVMLASLVVEDWIVHVLRVPAGLPWRGELRWSGLALEAQPGTEIAASKRGSAPASVVTGGGLTSAIVGLVGVRSAASAMGFAPPFAPQCIFPVAIAPRVGGRQPSWVAVASFFGPTLESPGIAASPRAVVTGRDELVIEGHGQRWTVRGDESLTVEPHTKLPA